MNKTLTIVLAAVLCAPTALGAGAGRQTPAAAGAPDRAPAARPPASAPDAPPLDEAGRQLVRGSRAAILAAGFSEPFFDRHFTPFKVFNRPGDRRVVWRFRAGGHEAYLDDSVGFYTDRRGRRVDTHSVSSTLAAARDLRLTVTRRRAERLMRSCIGEFEGGAVVFQQFGARTALVFTAATASPPQPPQPAEWAEAGAGGDLRLRGGRKGPPVYVGAVDLETGRCLKGRARAGAPGPSRAGGPRRN